MNWKALLGGFFMICAIAISVYYRLTNIDMTETRLFVEYYHVWIGVAGLALCGHFLILKGTNE
jgi:hypothetical protein